MVGWVASGRDPDPSGPVGDRRPVPSPSEHQMTQRSPTSGPARDSGEPRSLTAPVNGAEPASHRGGRAAAPADPDDRAANVRRRAEEVLAEIRAFEELVDGGLVPDTGGLERLTTCALDLHVEAVELRDPGH